MFDGSFSALGIVKSHPSGHTTWERRRTSVSATSSRRIDVDMTSFGAPFAPLGCQLLYSAVIYGRSVSSFFFYKLLNFVVCKGCSTPNSIVLVDIVGMLPITEQLLPCLLAV